tara:strand:- start:980 stop:1393 length:414 start_codon:yes stop_codon:yes gene_type:complete
MKLNKRLYRVGDYRKLLETFWDKIKKIGYHKLPHGDRVRCYCGSRNKSKVLALLKEFAEIKIVYKKGMTASEVRAKFKKDKRLQRFWHRACFVCGEPDVTQRHHIIQIQNGGRNCKRNVIPICNKCHSRIHPWMKWK